MRNEKLREQSGKTSTNNPFDILFYLLLKDGTLTPDKLEEKLQSISDLISGTTIFNNGWLGQYAINSRKYLESLTSVVSSKIKNTENAIDELTDDDSNEIIAQLEKYIEDKKNIPDPQWEEVEVD